MDETTTLVRRTRRSYSLVGFGFTLLSVVAITVQLLMLYLPGMIMGEGDRLSGTSLWMWLCSSVPMYLFAFPACFLMLQVLPAQAPEKRSLTKKQFFLLLPMCACLMYGGNLVGTLLSLLLSWGKADNALMGYAMDNSPLKLLVMVILAPTLEELICRKLLIDRTVRYGEKLSVLMSGLIFGLLHQNLYQFFYAFALGTLFAYVYVRTGKIKYTIFLHMIINFLGSVVAPLILSAVDMEALSIMADQGFTMDLFMRILPGYTLLMAYSSALMGVSVWGLVLLIIKCRRLTWSEGEHLGFKQGLKHALVNVGMIIYILLCLGMCVLALFNR